MTNPVAYPSLHGQQAIEKLVWNDLGTIPQEWNDVSLVCGRCKAVEYQYFLYFAWGQPSAEDDPTCGPLPAEPIVGVKYPRPDLAYPFLVPYVTREHALFPEMTRGTDPAFFWEFLFRYQTCHWLSPSMSNQSVELFQLNWALFYGTADMAITLPSVYGNPPPTPDRCVTEANPWDSIGIKTIQPDQDDLPNAAGWLLCLMQSKIAFSNTNPGADEYQYRPLLMYTLDTFTVGNLPTNSTIFRAQEPNRFTLIHNPLNVPPHYAVLHPVPKLSVRPMPPNPTPPLTN